MEVNIKVEVTQDNWVDVIITALEGGSNYWYVLNEDHDSEGLVARLPEGDFDNLTQRIGRSLWHNTSYRLKVYDLENPDELLGVVSHASMMGAFASRVEDTLKVIDGSYDALNADNIFQWATMGEITFC